MSRHTKLPEWLIKTRAEKATTSDRPVQIKCAITGRPNSGKSSVVKKQLLARGFTVVHEFAGQIIEEYEQGLHTLHPVKECLYLFNEENFHRQVEAEHAVTNAELVFFDRYFYDPEPYFILNGKELPEYLATLPHQLCDVAFDFAGVPTWDDNGVRCEDPEWAKQLAPLFPASYEKRGVPTIHVPLIEIEDEVLTKTDKKKREKERLALAIEARYEYMIKELLKLYPEAKLPAAV